jgi:molybdenum cofactor synthesis domain-containing protein
MGFHEIGQKISVENALQLIYSKTPRLGVEEINVTDSLGRVAGSEIRSMINVPHFDRSAMDGFAVVAENTFGCTQQNPATLEISGESKMGETPAKVLARGQAIEVATGSQLPGGATAVVKVENTARIGDSLRVYFPVTPGENVSKIGEDIKKGDIVVESGQIMRPQEISVLLACGVLRIMVAKRPVVSVVATGNELMEPKPAPVPGMVFDVNSYSLSAYIKQYGGIPVNMGIVRDSFEELKNALESALRYDILVFTGSTSVGKKDMLPEVVSSIGEIVFHGVSMRPGGPMAFGCVNGKQVFLLPGFPVAAMITFETFVGPTIRKMMGSKILDPRAKVEAVLASRVPSTLGRRDIVRARLETNKDGITVAFPLRSAGSGIISSMTKADGVIEIPEDIEGLEKGSKVMVKLFHR